MARTLEEMELVGQNIKLLGEEGVIPPLVEMLSKNLDSIDVALSALVKLSSCQENKKLIAETGAVPLILEHMFSHFPIMVRARCSEILARLSFDDGIEFLVDAHGARLELDPIVTNLLAIQQNPILNPSIRKPALCALLGICKSEEKLVEMAVTGANGVSIILPLLEDTNWEIREVAINLLFCFSQHEPQGIADFLLVQGRLEAFMRFLEDDNRANVQMAAAGLLAYLPKSEVILTEKLVESDALPVLLRILRSGTTEAKENVLGALFRFMDPANVDMQKMMVELGAYPLLVSFLESGTITAKARAAALIGNLSSNSSKFSTPIGSEATGCWCFRPARVPVCKVHAGICSMTNTFCMLEAKALPKLVNLLRERVHETSYEAVQALATLVKEDLFRKGASVLHEARAIFLILEILSWGTSDLKEEALNLLEKVFMVEEVAVLYCSMARIPLVSLTTRSQEDGRLGRMAARVLSQLEHYSRSMRHV